MDPFGWYMGKYGKRGIDPRPGPSSFKVCSRFDQETADTLKRFMSDVVDDSNNFVMSWDDAYHLIAEHCEGSLEILGEFEMEYWQICKKSYHGINFGVDPVDYGMTQSQLEEINKQGVNCLR